MAVSIDEIKKLREETQMSIARCREALEEAGGDFAKAKEILRKKGAELAEKKGGREAANGVIESYIHTDKRLGVLLDLRAETDFVARSEAFRTLAHEVAMHIAAMNPSWISPDDIPPDVHEAEQNIYREQFQESGKSKEVVEQIIEGKMRKYAEDHCLLNQPYIRDEDKTIRDLINEYIGKLGENIRIERFTRYSL